MSKNITPGMIDRFARVKLLRAGLVAAPGIMWVCSIGFALEKTVDWKDVGGGSYTPVTDYYDATSGTFTVKGRVSGNVLSVSDSNQNSIETSNKVGSSIYGGGINTNANINTSLGAAPVDDNEVTIISTGKDGVMNTVTVYGGFIGGSTATTQTSLSGNSVVIHDQVAVDGVYGASNSASSSITKMSNNTVTLHGGTYSKNNGVLHGAISSSGVALADTAEVENNGVTIDLASGGGTLALTGATPKIYGAIATGCTVKSNYVNIMANSTSTITDLKFVDVYAGSGKSAISNTVTINMTDVTKADANKFGTINGGVASDGAADSNTLTLTSVNMGNNVFGGKYEGTAGNSASSNTVTVTNGYFQGASDTRIVGGYENGTTVANAGAHSNTVTVTGTEFGNGTVPPLFPDTNNIYGGFSTNNSANSNTVTVEDVTVEASSDVLVYVYGGNGASVDDNEVTVKITTITSLTAY